MCVSPVCAAVLEDLRTAISTANTSIAAYTAANEKLTQMQTLTEQTNVYTAEALNTYYTTPKSKYDNNTLTNDEANALQNPFTTTSWRADINVDNFLLSAWNTNPDFTDAPYYINTWSTEGNSDGSGMTTPFFEYFVDNGAEAKLAERTLTATLSDVAAGNYYVDVLVRVGKNSGSDETPTGITLNLNGGENVNICAGTADSNGRFYGTFRAFGTVGDDGVLAININVAADNNVHWLAFKNVKYAVFAGATEAQKSALAAAITNAEGKTLGFEDGQYAPYNNIDALAALAAANSLDVENATGDEVVAAANAIGDDKWEANTDDVDAIYNGLFATVTDGQNYPNGWSRTNGWGQMRSGISGDYATAYYNQPGSLVYGSTGAYTMPLAANQVYRLTFAYRSHENNSNNKVTASVLKGEEGLAATVFAGNGSTSNWKVVSKRFKTGTAGNYVLTLANDGNTWMTGVSLVKAEADAVTIDENVDYTAEASEMANVTLSRTFSDTNWNTFVVPFDIDNSTLTSKFADVEIAEFSETADGDNSTISFTKMATPAITANTPVLLKTTTTGDITFEGVEIKDGEAKVAGTNFDFVGTYNATTDIAEGDYFISANKLYKSAGATTVKGTRAYLKTKNAGARIAAFVIGDETTGIAGVENTSKANDRCYDLQGRMVNADNQQLKGGLYIKNGRKVVVK